MFMFFDLCLKDVLKPRKPKVSAVDMYQLQHIKFEAEEN